MTAEQRATTAQQPLTGPTGAPPAGGSGGGPPAGPAPGAAAGDGPSPAMECLSGAVPVAHRPGGQPVRRLWVRAGTTVTVELSPTGSGPWSAPHTGNPMLAAVTSASTAPDGAARATLRTARTGSVTVTWDAGDTTAAFTLRLDVAGHPAQ